MPKSTTRTPAGSSSAARRLRHLHPEPVVAQEDVPDAGDAGCRLCVIPRSPSWPPQRLDLGGREEEAVARLTPQAEVPAGVVVQRDGDVDPVLVVLHDRLDGGRSCRPGPGRRCRRRAAASADAVARPQVTPPTCTESGAGIASSPAQPSRSSPRSSRSPWLPGLAAIHRAPRCWAHPGCASPHAGA